MILKILSYTLDGGVILSILTLLMVTSRRSGHSQAEKESIFRRLDRQDDAFARIETQVVNPNSGGMRQKVDETALAVSRIEESVRLLPASHLVWHRDMHGGSVD